MKRSTQMRLEKMSKMKLLKTKSIKRQMPSLRSLMLKMKIKSLNRLTLWLNQRLNQAWKELKLETF